MLDETHQENDVIIWGAGNHPTPIQEGTNITRNGVNNASAVIETVFKPICRDRPLSWLIGGAVRPIVYWLTLHARFNPMYRDEKDARVYL